MVELALPPAVMAPLGKTAATLDLGSARALIADHDAMNHHVATTALRGAGWDTVDVEADSPAVMEALEAHAIDVVLLDPTIPDALSGNVVQRIHGDRRYVSLPIVLLASPVTRDLALAFLARGADDIIMKPIDPALLIARIGAALRARRAILGMEAAHRVITLLAEELNSRDADIQRNTERIGQYAAELGRRAGLSAADLNAVAYAILLHDLGRIGISESILLKRGPLTNEEREALERHTEIGARMAAPLPGAERLGPVIRHHHERWDGGGYPDGLSGEAIPMGARIIAIVDAFDAMTQFRPYRQPKSVTEAIAELRRERGHQFDRRLVDAFVQVVEWDGLPGPTEVRPR